MERIELLAPAGDLERLKIASLYGADAVYIGGNVLGLRANATNFTLDEIKEGVIYAHNLNKKVYVTVNIALHNKELKLLKDYLISLDKIGVDAIIFSDLTVLEYAKKYTNLCLHLSTQASSLNHEAVNFYKKLGVERVVLARECNKEDIKNIIDNVDIETEVFIHGAMCSSISGRCVMSNFLTNRDSNRGGCSQICRWDFDLYKDDKIIKGEKPFTFCTKDLCLIEYIPDLINIGVSSLKIEGRMRSSYYIATIVSTYRKAIDNYYNNKKLITDMDIKILNRCANRDSYAQFFNGNNDVNCCYYNGRIEVSNQDFLGVVIDYKDNMVTVEQRNYFKKGDIVEFFGPNHDVIKHKIDEIYDEEGNIIDIVNKPLQIVRFKTEEKLDKFDFMRKNIVDKI